MMLRFLTVWMLSLAAGTAVTTAQAGDGPQSPDDIWALALAHDPVLGAAEAEEAAGLNAYRLRRATLLPTVTATGSAARIDSEIESEFFTSGSGGKLEQNYDAYTYGLSLRQPLFRWDLLNRLEVGKVEVIAAEVRLKRVRQELVGRVATAYTGVLAAEDALQTARATKTAVSRQLSQVRDQVDVGAIAVTGLREAEAEQDLAEASLIDAQLALDDAVDQLARMIGTASFDLAHVKNVEALEPIVSVPLADWLAASQERNTNVVAARLAAELARLDMRTNEADRYPQLDLAASYNRNDTSESVIGQDAEEGRIGLELTIPLYTGGATRARIESARATYLQRTEELRRALELAESEVRTAWRTVRASKRRIAARRKAVASTAAALAAVRDGYEVGSRTLSDVLAAERAALQAQQSFNQARYDYVVAVIDLKLAAGTVTDNDLPLIDAVFTGKETGSSE